MLFDPRAWWEVLTGSAEGASLKKRYLDRPGVRVFTSAITHGELAAKLASEGRGEEAPPVVASLRRASEIIDVTAEIAVKAGALREALRQNDRAASLADGIVLATARELDARLVSAERAFHGLPDVVER